MEGTNIFTTIAASTIVIMAIIRYPKETPKAILSINFKSNIIFFKNERNRALQIYNIFSITLGLNCIDLIHMET